MATTLVGAFGLSDQEFEKLGIPLIPETTRLSPSQGGGFFGTLEVFHQLHCVVCDNEGALLQHESSYLMALTYIELYSPVHLQRILLALTHGY